MFVLAVLGLLLSACTTPLDLDFDVPIGHYRRHVYKDPGKAGSTTADFQIIEVYKDPDRKWFPGFENGCFQGKHVAFKLMGLAVLDNGDVKEGVMSVGVAGVRDKEAVTSRRLLVIEAGKTYHFQYSWTADGFHTAAVDGDQESASGMGMPNKIFRISASTTHVKFSHVVYDSE